MYELIAHRRLDSAASSIAFSNIPQIYTDLLIVGSTRVTGTGIQNIAMNINGDTSSNYSYRMLYTQDAATPAAAGESSSAGIRWFYSNASNSTTSTFSNFQLRICNYRSSSPKSISYEHTTEQNGTNPFIQGINAGLWNSSSAINSLVFNTDVPASISFVADSSISLYGINRTTAIGRYPQALGGQINYANGYWYHTFTGSGTFVPFNNMQVEYLIVAGGGGGGANGSQAGGGGAGGYRSSVVGERSGSNSPAESMLSLAAGTNYPVVVGAGGIGGNWGNAMPTNGSNSSFGGITSTGGGYGGTVGPGVTWYQASSGGSSGGGGPVSGDSPAPSVSNQGFIGGNYVGTNSSGGGGGGASEPGNTDGPCAGGDGLPSSITGTLTVRAGGGAGGNSNNNGVGGDGGGGNTGVAGVANTGGGGGAGTSGNNNGMAGGSGVVIVRYKG